MNRSADMLGQLKDELAAMADPDKAALLAGFFKTGKGQYGEGDVFLGITVPRQRAAAKKYPGLSLTAIGSLLKSKFHEHRLTGLIILTGQYARADEARREKIFEFYLANARRINNWDLVDVSAPNIVGEFLRANPGRRGVLKRLARSENLWERRIAVLATGAFIRAGVFAPTLDIARMLLHDGHDLIHKAAGWMLREVGKRDRRALEGFLDEHAAVMPRTMLRYAIERFAPARRRHYMNFACRNAQSL